MGGMKYNYTIGVIYTEFSDARPKIRITLYTFFFHSRIDMQSL